MCALVRFMFRVLEALPQPLERLDQVVALAGERAVLRLDLAQLFLRAQIDGAEPLALAAQPLNLGFHLGDVRQRLVGRDPGKACDLGGPDLEPVVNFPSDLAEPALAHLQALFRPRPLPTARAQRLERRTLSA